MRRIALRKLAALAQNAKPLELFLDYDGVLADIAARPELALLPNRMRSLLRALSNSPSVRVTIVSGRQLKDIRRRVGIPGITYVGNHGLELAGPALRRVHAIPGSTRRVLRRIAARLRQNLRAIPGVLIEDKDLVIGVHTRLSSRKDVPRVRLLVRSIVSGENEGKAVKITEGKELLEVRPSIAVHKGQAVAFLLRNRYGKSWRKRSFPVYIGDDATDEDAFNALGNTGLTIWVGAKGGKTSARYTLRDTGEVFELLQLIQNR